PLWTVSSTKSGASRRRSSRSKHEKSGTASRMSRRSPFMRETCRLADDREPALEDERVEHALHGGGHAAVGAPGDVGLPLDVGVVPEVHRPPDLVVELGGEGKGPQGSPR